MEFEDSLLVQRFCEISMNEESGLGKMYQQQLTLHCSLCHTVLGDSSGTCGEIQRLDSIMCSNVTTDIVVGHENELGREGGLANCIYRSLSCRCCDRLVGKVIISAPPCLSMIRSYFLLHKPDIYCYILGSRSMVKAVTIAFDVKPLMPTVNEVGKHFQNVLEKITDMKRKVMANNSNIKNLSK